MDLKELESGVDPKTHWYYQSKKVPLFRYFEKVVGQLDEPITVIDFGSGSGFFAYELEEAYPDAIKEILLVDIGYTEAEMAATQGQKVRKLHFIPEGISHCIVIMMDVLEHIEDDYAILEEIQNKTGEHAYFFITVPALAGKGFYLAVRFLRKRLWNKAMKSVGCPLTDRRCEAAPHTARWLSATGPSDLPL